MNLCIDIGNTRIKIYGAKKDKVELLWVAEEWPEGFKALEKIIKKNKIKHGILSTTRNENPVLLDFLENKLKAFFLLDHATDLPIEILYETPKTLGRDRIAVVVAAQHLFPNKNSLVVNAGTCITYDFITVDKKYLGGSIAPGMRMRFNAMHTFTDRLPLVEPIETPSFIGTTTNTSMITGVVEGCIAEIEGRIQQYRHEFGDLQGIITGGDGSFFGNKMKNKIFVHPNLLPIGLNAILEYNI